MIDGPFNFFWFLVGLLVGWLVVPWLLLKVRG